MMRRRRRKDAKGRRRRRNKKGVQKKKKNKNFLDREGRRERERLGYITILVRKMRHYGALGQPVQSISGEDRRENRTRGTFPRGGGWPNRREVIVGGEK